MNKRTFLALGVVGLALVVAGGALVASNMGFKLNYLLENAGTIDGTNTIGLPYNPQVGIVTAGDLAGDIGGFTTAMGPVLNVQRFDNTSNTFSAFAGGRSGNFNLAAGECYRIQINANTDYIVVGSHDPSKTVALANSGTIDGTNEYAPPYHTTAVDAGDLAAELGGFTTAGGPVLNVQRFDPTMNILSPFAGGRSGNFNLAPGECYRVQVNQDVTTVPAHF